MKKLLGLALLSLTINAQSVPTNPPTNFDTVYTNIALKYEGIPDPNIFMGFDVFSDYPVDELLNGNYGNYIINAIGTAEDPYVIDAYGATFTRLTINGSYIILMGATIVASTEGPFRSTATRSVYKDIDVSGNNYTNWGAGSATNLGEYTVWIGGKVHNFGLLGANDPENDQHGFKTYGPYHWILEVETYALAGDGVQVGDASRGIGRNVYIAGGYYHNNRENAVDIKDSEDIVVSGIYAENFERSSTSEGAAIVVHDDAYRSGIYANVIRNSRIGIVSSGLQGHIITDNNIEALSEGIQLRNTRDLFVQNNDIIAPVCINNQSGTTGIIQTGCN